MAEQQNLISRMTAALEKVHAKMEATEGGSDFFNEIGCLIAEGKGEYSPQGPLKIKRMIAAGDLAWAPHETSDDILNEIARILDKGYVDLGTIYFEAENGKFYTAGVLSQIFEVDKEQIDEFLELEAEWGAEPCRNT